MLVSRDDTDNGYSTTVRAALHIGGVVLPIAQLGPGKVTLRESANLSERSGEVEFSIDGETQFWNVTLLDDLRADQLVVRLAR